MSPLIEGNPARTITATTHVPLGGFTAPDIIAQLEAARARRASTSPIRTPDGGWPVDRSTPKPVKKAKEKPAPRPADARSQWDTTTARDLAAQGLTARQIAEAVGVTIGTVRQWAKRHGVTIGYAPRAARTGRRPSWDTAAGVRLARAGRTAQEIGDTLGCSKETVRRVLKGAGVTLVDGRGGNTSHVDVDDAARLAGQGLTAREIAERYGVTPQTVRRVLKGAGVTLVDGRGKFSGGANRLADLDHAHVAGRYAALGSARAVAAELGVSQNTVLRSLHAAGVTVQVRHAALMRAPGVDRAGALRDLMAVNGVTAADVKAWARAQGRDVHVHGIPSRALVEDYLLATKGGRS